MGIFGPVFMGGFSLRDVIDCGNLLLSSAYLIVGIFVAILSLLILCEAWPSASSIIDRALVHCSNMPIPVVSTICGSVRIDQPGENKGNGWRGELSFDVHAHLVSKIVDGLQREGSFTLRASCPDCQGDSKEADDIAKYAAATVIDLLDFLSLELERLQAAAVRTKTAWWFRGNPARRVLQSAEKINSLFHTANNRYKETVGRVESQPMDNIKGLVCVWAQEITDHLEKRRNELKGLRRRLERAHVPAWNIYEHGGWGAKEDPHHLEEQIASAKTEVRDAEDSLMRSLVACSGSKVAVAGLKQIKKRFVSEIKNIKHYKRTVDDISNQLARDGDWRHAEQLLMDTVQEYMDKLVKRFVKNK
ncbi:hypothetical protein ACJZ2D_009763 [Fusarium nematophilum]